MTRRLWLFVGGGLAAVLAAIALVAWSPWASPASSPASGGDVAMADLMSKAGCVNNAVTQTAMYARETGNCEVGSQFVQFDTFASTELRDKYLEFGAQFGGSPDVVGGQWLVHCDDPATRELLAKTLGGHVA